jgi:integrase
MTALGRSIQEYLALRRSLGFKLREASQALPDFAAFMERRHASYITERLALSWAQKPKHAQPSHWASRLRHVRQFARYRSASDPRTQIPALGLLPFRPKRARPYLYTDREIAQLLDATLHLPLSPKHRKNCALLPWVYYSLFGLLSVSGLRLGEARNLKLDDLDLAAGVLTVRGSKFGKDRWVPLHASTCRVLGQYLDKRARFWAGRSVSSYVFVSSWGNRLDVGAIHRAFYAASRRIGLRGARDSKGPRLHDIRHRFATTTLVNWYRSKEDPERRLPLLSAFLGVNGHGILTRFGG